MIQVTLYSRTGCHLCEQVQTWLAGLQKSRPHQLQVVDIESNPTLYAQYFDKIPVVFAGTLHLQAPITENDLRILLARAR